MCKILVVFFLVKYQIKFYVRISKHRYKICNSCCMRIIANYFNYGLITKCQSKPQQKLFTYLTIYFIHVVYFLKTK